MKNLYLPSLLLALCLVPATPFVPMFGRSQLNMNQASISLIPLIPKTYHRLSPLQSSIKPQIETTGEEAIASIASATSSSEIESLRVSLLGKKGSITGMMSLMRDLQNEEKKEFGRTVNEVKGNIEKALEARKEEVEREELMVKMESERIDVTTPGIMSQGVGRRHPLSMTMERATEIFMSLGYDTVTECEER